MIAVVRGNDFRLRIPIRRNVVHNNGTTSYEPLDISALNDLHVFLEDETMCAKELSWFIDTENASSIIADVPACMQEGKYALILLGKYSDDRRFRSKERKQLRLVETNEKANVTPFDLDGFDAYALDTMIVMDGRGRDGLTAYEIAVAHGYEGTEEEWIESLHNVSDADKERWNSKQDALTFDNLPTQGSNNPVKSSGIYNRMHILTTAIQQVSEDVGGKQDTLTFDNTPTANSDNPVKSGGVKSAIDEHTENSAIHVTAQDKTKWNGYESTLTGMATQINTRTLKTSDVKVYATDDLSYSTQIGEIKSNAGKFTVESGNTINITTSGEDTDINLTASDGDVKLQSGKDINIQGYEATNITGSNDLNMSAGYVTLTATEGTTVITSADNVTISAGSSSVNKEINLNANAVKVNGTNIDTIKNNAQNALNKINAMYPNEGKGMQIETPGIYYAYPGFGDPDIIPSSMNHGAFTGYLLLVTHVVEADIHGSYTYLHQLIIDIVTGRKATRSIQLPSTGDIDWSTAPNFTEV